MADQQRIKAIKTGPLNSGWKGDAAGYKAIHLRLYAQARPEACEECAGTEGRMEWALRADAPVEDLLTSPEGWRYSANPEHYRNLCKTCHNRQDLGRTTCKKAGHPLVEGNLYTNPGTGKKVCRACQLRRYEKRNERRRAATRAKREQRAG